MEASVSRPGQQQPRHSVEFVCVNGERPPRRMVRGCAPYGAWRLVKSCLQTIHGDSGLHNHKDVSRTKCLESTTSVGDLRYEALENVRYDITENFDFCLSPS